MECALESDQPADQQRAEYTYDHDELFVAHSEKGNLNPRPLQRRRSWPLGPVHPPQREQLLSKSAIITGIMSRD
jgi:hypothetical protein